MEQAKAWYLSRTIWASLVTVALSLAGLAGFQVSAADSVALTEMLLQAVTALCGLVAIVGRLRATDRIG